VDVLFVTGQFLRPDLVVVSRSARESVTSRGVEAPPALMVEILSPSSRSIDRVRKPRRYAEFGVPEYWVVDPDERCVWVWRFAAGATEPDRVEGGWLATAGDGGRARAAARRPIPPHVVLTPPGRWSGWPLGGRRVILGPLPVPANATSQEGPS
jgi:hypothetical protein